MGASLWPLRMPVSSSSSSLGTDWQRWIRASATVAASSPRTSRSMGSKVVVNLGARMRAFLRFQACTVVPYYN